MFYAPGKDFDLSSSCGSQRYEVINYKDTKRSKPNGGKHIVKILKELFCALILTREKLKFHFAARSKPLNNLKGRLNSELKNNRYLK